MKNVTIVIILFFISLGLSAQNKLQEQAKVIFEQVVMPNENGSVRNLHKTTWAYSFMGDCIDLEDKSKQESNKDINGEYSVKYQYPIAETNVYYLVTCYEGYGGNEYNIEIRSLSKELLEEVQKLTDEYFEKNLKKNSANKYLLGDFETAIRKIDKVRNSEEWHLTLYMSNNAW